MSLLLCWIIYMLEESLDLMFYFSSTSDTTEVVWEN